MGLTVHEIDPNGDTLLILYNVNAPFAELESFSTPQEEQNESASAPKDDAADKSQEPDSKPTVQMRLSSKHLVLASAYFKKMTANNWKENTPEAGYLFVVHAHDWDEEALVVLMNIIHGRTAKVPREVKLEMLAKIAVMVDYYQCHEVVAFFAQTWLSVESLKLIQDEGERNYMLRLVVSLVFPENESLPFWILTEKIIQESSGPIDSLGLPIREDVIDALNLNREMAIWVAMQGLRNLQTRLGEDETSCSFECSSIYLGALSKAMRKMKIAYPSPNRPYPTSPYPGLSLLTLEETIRNIREPNWKSNCPSFSAPATSTASSTTSATKPAPASAQPRSLFGGPPLPPTTTFTFRPPAAASASPFPGPPSTPPVELPKFAPMPSALPACNLAAKTKPIIDELLKEIKGLNLDYYVKKQ